MVDEVQSTEQREPERKTRTFRSKAMTYGEAIAHIRKLRAQRNVERARLVNSQGNPDKFVVEYERAGS